MSKYNKPDYCPDWFDLADYEILNEFNKYHFYHLADQIKANSNLLDELDNDLVEDKALITDIVYSQYKEMKTFLSLIFSLEVENDILIEPTIDFFYSKKLGALLSLGKTFKELEKLNDAFKNTDIDGFKYDESLNGMLKNRNITINIDDLIEEFKPDNDLCFIVNLDYSDDAIIAELRSRLKKYRKQKEGKVYTDIKIKRLIENRVFPYLDLLLWGKLTGNQLTQVQMANLLFPDLYDVDIVNKLRLSTIPKAEQILNGEIKFI